MEGSRHKKREGRMIRCKTGEDISFSIPFALLKTWDRNILHSQSQGVKRRTKGCYKESKRKLMNAGYYFIGRQTQRKNNRDISLGQRESLQYRGRERERKCACKLEKDMNKGLRYNLFCITENRKKLVHDYNKREI